MKLTARKNKEFKLVLASLEARDDPFDVYQQVDSWTEKLIGPEIVLIYTEVGSPCWLSDMLTHAAHATPNVASYDHTREGYVVINSHSGRFRPGDIIPANSIGMRIVDGRIVGGKPLRHLMIAVGGPPHSGKSVFLSELHRQLCQKIGAGNCFYQQGCPDGEGIWSSETDFDTVRKVRKKGQFSQSFCEWVEKALPNLRKNFAITLVDLGGKLLPPNELILQKSTHLLLLSSNEEETQKWINFGQEHGCEIIAVLASRLQKIESDELDDAARSSVDLTTSPVKGEMVNLDRKGSKAPYQETIDQFADWLVSQL